MAKDNYKARVINHTYEFEGESDDFVQRCIVDDILKEIESELIDQIDLLKRIKGLTEIDEILEGLSKIAKKLY